MKFKVVLSSGFRKQLKPIAKKHRQILNDIAQFIEDISVKPEMGTHLGSNVYKIRLAISGSLKGKSGGARVITWVKIQADTVVLAEIYLKNEHDTVDVDKVIKRLADDGHL